MEIEYRVHWLSITVWTTFASMQRIWDLRFKPKFGPLIDMGHGGPGFRSIHKSISEIKIYSDPTNTSGDGDTYISLQIPGAACDALEPYFIMDLINDLIENYKTNVTRLDFAFDHAPFTPSDFDSAIRNEKFRSYAKKETYEFHDSPFKSHDEGEGIGCETAELGSRQSTRRLKVYNKRGFTRIELETRDERADHICKLVLTKDPIYWGELLLGHLRDFIDLLEDRDSGLLVGFWAEFIQAIPRAGLTVTDPKQITKDRMMGWLLGGVSPALSAAVDIYGEDVLDELYEYGKENRSERYNPILPEDKKTNKGGKRD